MLYLGNFDFNHVVMVSKEKPFKLKLVKCDCLVENANTMIDDFLHAYDLTPESLDNFANVFDIQEHLLSIQTQYGCDLEYLKLKGIAHLEECKHQAIFTNQSHMDELVPVFDTLLDDFEREMAEGVTEFSLPVLEITKQLFQKQYYKEHVKDSLQNTLIVMSQQGFLTVKELMQALLDLDIPANNLILTTKPHTTSETNYLNFKQLAQDAGFEYQSTSPQYHEAIKTYENHLKENPDNKTLPYPNYALFKEIGMKDILDTIHTKMNSGIFDNMIIHDEGGELIKSFSEQRLNEIKQSGVRISTSEHTTCGKDIRKSIAALNTQPCFDMAGSGLKAKLEAFFIAEASFLKSQDIIQSLRGSLKKLKVAVVGAGGNIGSHFFKLLREKYGNDIELIACEQNTFKLKTLQDELNCGALNSMLVEEVFCHSDIIFGATGHDITHDVDISILKHREPLTLVSLSSGTREYKTWLSKVGENQSKLTIKNHGLPIIFDGCLHGIHPLKIQLIRALTMTTVMLQLMYLSIAPKLKLSKQVSNHQAYDEYHQENQIFKVIDGQIQSFILNMYRRMITRLERHNEYTTFFRMDFIQTVIDQIKTDLKSPLLKMKHEAIEQLNAFATVDQNHQIHLLKLSTGYQLYLSKHHQKIYDFKMIEAVLVKVNVDILQFLKMPAHLKLNTLAEKFQSFQMNVHSLEEQYCPYDEQSACVVM